MLFPFLPLSPAASSSPVLVEAYHKTKQELMLIEEELNKSVHNTEQTTRLNEIKQAKIYEIDQMELLLLQQRQMDYRSMMRQTLNAAIENLILYLIRKNHENIFIKREDEDLFFEITQKTQDPQLAIDYEWIMNPAFEADISFDICCQLCNVDSDRLRANIKHKIQEAPLENKIRILKMLRSIEEAKKATLEEEPEEPEESKYRKRRTTWGASQYL